MAVEISARSERSKPEPPYRTSGRQDLVSVLLAAWMTIGGFVDGFAHRNLDTPETFFTPWHGILYSGYLATALWVLGLVVRNRPSSPSLRLAIPEGYSTAVVGVLVFALGGIGDMFWHMLFGIEVSVDALLSPTHLLLLVGSLLIISGPLRARWWDPGYQPTRLVDFWVPALAASMGAAQLGFFFQYIDGLSIRFMQVPYNPGSEEGFFELVTGIAAILITTLTLMGALLLVMRRWKPPWGAGLIIFGLVGVLMETLEGYDFPEVVVAPLIGGLTTDLLVQWVWSRWDRLAAVRVTAFVVPVSMWSVRFAVFERFSDINWPVSVWSGTIVFAGLAGVGLSLLAFPPFLGVLSPWEILELPVPLRRRSRRQPEAGR